MELEKGVEILNSTEIIGVNNKTESVICLLFLFIGICIFIYGLYNLFYKSKLKYSVYTIIGIIFICLLGMFLCKSTGKYEYQITIDDSVSFNEFMNKYEIIDKQGKIYTVRLREEEDGSKSKETER